jgi:hypothetical protein
MLPGGIVIDRMQRVVGADQKRQVIAADQDALKVERPATVRQSVFLLARDRSLAWIAGAWSLVTGLGRARFRFVSHGLHIPLLRALSQQALSHNHSSVPLALNIASRMPRWQPQLGHFGVA